MDKEIEKKQSLFFDMKPLSVEDMGEKLLRVSCNLLGIGPNRNGSNITKDAVINANKNLKHIPVVAHLIKDDDGSYYIGGHDFSVEFQPELEIRELTVPVGCVAGDSEFEFIDIKESDNSIREYLKCDLIIWKHLAPIMEAAYSDEIYFNESIEISDIEGTWDTDDGSFRIDFFNYDKACLLGLNAHDTSDKRHTEPCFRKSIVYPKQYSINCDFNKQFALLLKEINDFNLEIKNSNLNITKEQLNNDNTTNLKEEDSNLANDEKILDGKSVFVKISEILNDLNFRSKTGKTYNKYEIDSIDDNFVNVFDREDCYRPFSIPYIATEAENGLSIAIDYEHKIEKSLGFVEKKETGFNIQNEIEMISLDFATFKVAEHQSDAITKLTNDLDTMTINYTNAQLEIEELKKQVGVFEKEKDIISKQQHKNSIDLVINTYAEIMGKDSDFLAYRANVDYSESVENIEKELKIIHSDFNMKNLKKHSFNANYEICGVVGNKNLREDPMRERYGDAFDKF